MKVAGFDIGGANTDLAVVDFENNEVKNIEVDFAYLPMWSNNEALPKVLTELIENIDQFIKEIKALGSVRIVTESAHYVQIRKL